MSILYSRMKVFHFRDKVDSIPGHLDHITAPIHIRIKPTNGCNHNCWYCSYRAANLQLGKDMVGKDQIPRDKMLELLEDIIGMGVKALTFSGGGDPFVYPHLLESVRILARSPIKFAALTNGSRLRGELAEIFAHHATWLRVSMDGWDDLSYSEARGVGDGEFTKIMNNMERFKALGGKCYLGVSLIVHHGNAPHVYDLLRQLKECGVDSIKVSPCVASDDKAKNSAYHEPIFETVKEQVQRGVSELRDSTFEISDAYHVLDDKFTKEYTWCPYLQILTVIGADLNVYACQDKAYNLDTGVIGSIRDRRFADFWFEDKSKFFRIDPTLHCRHHCETNPKNRLLLDYLEIDREHLEFV